MRAESSLEAREVTAAHALHLDAEETRGRITEAPPPEHVVRLPDTSNMAASANESLADDPWRAALMAEAWVAGARRATWKSLRRALDRAPLVLRREPDPLSLDVTEAATIAEANPARRDALQAAAESAVTDVRGDARAVIDALRVALGALDPVLVRSLAIGEDAHGDLLDATEEVYRELDERVCRAHQVDRARLTWAERLRTLQGPSVLAAIPSATWASLGARMYERVGLDLALRGVVDDLRPAAANARGVCALVTAPGERAVVAGRPVLAAWGAADVMGSLSVAAASVTGVGVFPGLRRGRDRVMDGVAHALVRRLLIERRFLQREAGVDAAPRERVLIEAAHGELLRLRLDVALSRFAAHVLARAPEAGVRFHDELMRAWGAAPPPSWAPWVASGMFESGGFWGGRWMSRASGARIEPLLVDGLRARFDEDWFRNPKAGHEVSSAFNDLRASGADAWCEAHGGAVDAQRTVARFTEVVREARRSV